jgi:hypothetical protein
MVSLTVPKEIRDICTRLHGMGYGTRIDKDGRHPKIYINSQGKERFVIFSFTNNWGITGVHKKWKDIEHELAQLPKPVQHGGTMKITPDVAQAIDKAITMKPAILSEKTIKDQGEVPLNGVEHKQDNTYKDPSLKSELSYPMRLTVGGRGDGGLTIAFPVSVRELFPGKDHCDLLYIEGRSIGVAFRERGRAKIGAVRGGKDCMAYFPRADLPFDACLQGQERVFAKAIGDGLVGPALPVSLLGGKKAPTLKSEDRAAEGVELKKLFNEWLVKAKAEGMDPSVSFDPKTCTISIQVAERRTRSL